MTSKRGDNPADRQTSVLEPQTPLSEMTKLAMNNVVRTLTQERSNLTQNPQQQRIFSELHDIQCLQNNEGIAAEILEHRAGAL
jgi:hypothetical protein